MWMFTLKTLSQPNPKSASENSLNARVLAGGPTARTRLRSNFQTGSKQLRIVLAVSLISLLLAACDDGPAPTSSAGSELFKDDFSQDSGLWEIFTGENGASVAIADERMGITVAAPSTVGVSIAAINLTDFDLTVTTTQISGGLANGYGVIFRYIDENNFYRFDISGDGLWGVSRRLEDQWIPIVELTASSAIQTGYASNTLRVVARGDRFEFYANGVLLGQAANANLPVGRIGLFASTFDDPDTHVSFDDLVIVSP